MPISVVSDDTRPWVTAFATGTLTFAELTEFIRNEQAGDRRHAPVLLDATAANTNMSGLDAQRLPEDLMVAVGQTERRGPVAIIATDDILFGLVRIWQL